MDTYTGQKSYTSSFGLMYYNARWYDPSLGRFAQADSIIPPGVQGLDRYAYVGNSPLVYSDPSGHIACIDGEYCSKPKKLDRPDALSDSDLVSLTRDGKYTGEKMYELYLFYFKTNGWWHSSSFDPDGHFSIFDFLVLIVFAEMNGIGDKGKDTTAQGAYATAIAKNISFGCAGSCSGGASNNAMLNYISGRESARRRYNAYQDYLKTGDIKNAGLGPIRNGIPILDNNHDPQVARDTVNAAMQNISSEGALWDYGNVYDKEGDPFLLSTKISDYYSAPIGACVTCVYWKSADSQAYVMTQDQIACWRFGEC